MGLTLGLSLSGNDDGEVERLERQLVSRDRRIAALAEDLDEAEQQLAAAQASAEQATDGQVRDAGSADEPPVTTDDRAAEAAADDTSSREGEYTAGNYTFTDVQVSEDFVGDFEVRTRMTNTGSAKNSVAITATLFSEGTVIGTATGFASDIASDTTITLGLVSTDEYGEWDAVEFQVDMEF